MLLFLCTIYYIKQFNIVYAMYRIECFYNLIFVFLKYLILKIYFFIYFQLIEHILETLSSIIILMCIETLNRDCIPILTNILNLYKKCQSAGIARYWVSQYLASFLSVVPENMLEPVIDNLFSILHEMVILVILKIL